jgi:NADPH-dependent 2,4-dienoyl-CoA reductase/sulfur reductase-like enzyme
VLASGKTINCDFAVAAVGITIHKDLLRGTPIAAEQAILVDATCRTSVPGIFAAGDCAAIFDPLFGRHRMLHHWDSAAKIGAIAGVNMAGGNAAFNTASYFDTKLFDLEIGVWGDARSVDRRVIRGAITTESPSFIEFGVSADGRAAQIIAVGDLSQGEILAKLIEGRVELAGKEELLKDPSQGLEGIVSS